MKVGLALALVLGAALPSGALGQEPAGAAPDFSETRLREGKEAYGARRNVEAVNQLRIAAFGFLDRPALLCESLVYLALADEAAERHTEARAAADRFLEVHSRFVGCGEAKLDKAARSEFESKFNLRLPVSNPAPASPSSPTPRPDASRTDAATGGVGHRDGTSATPDGRAGALVFLLEVEAPSVLVLDRALSRRLLQGPSDRAGHPDRRPPDAVAVLDPNAGGPEPDAVRVGVADLFAVGQPDGDPYSGDLVSDAPSVGNGDRDARRECNALDDRDGDTDRVCHGHEGADRSDDGDEDPDDDVHADADQHAHDHVYAQRHTDRDVLSADRELHVDRDADIHHDADADGDTDADEHVSPTPSSTPTSLPTVTGDSHADADGDARAAERDSDRDANTRPGDADPDGDSRPTRRRRRTRLSRRPRPRTDTPTPTDTPTETPTP